MVSGHSCFKLGQFKRRGQPWKWENTTGAVDLDDDDGGEGDDDDDDSDDDDDDDGDDDDGDDDVGDDDADDDADEFKRRGEPWKWENTTGSVGPDDDDDVGDGDDDDNDCNDDDDDDIFCRALVACYLWQRLLLKIQVRIRSTAVDICHLKL